MEKSRSEKICLDLFSQKGKFEIIDVPLLPYLIVYGQGNPNTSLEYIQAIEALFQLHIPWVQ